MNKRESSTTSGEGSNLRHGGAGRPGRSLHGLRRYSSCCPTPSYKRCSVYTTPTSHTDLCQTRRFPYNSHGVRDLSNENHIEQPTDHAFGFHDRNSHQWEPSRSTGFRNSHQHPRPTVHTHNDSKFSSVCPESGPNLLASGSHRRNLDVEERVESHDRMDGCICIHLSVPLLPIVFFFSVVLKLNVNFGTLKASSPGLLS